MRKIRVLLADDHTIVRKGLRSLLDGQAEIEVVGEAEDGREAVEKAQQLLPDVVLLDLEMPEMDGVEVLDHLRRESLDARVVVFTAFDTDDRIVAALHAGA